MVINMTTKPTFTSQISLGNWITLIVLACSLAVGWGAMKAQQEAVEATLTKVETQHAAHRNAVLTRLRILENEDARSQERYSALLQLLNRIDGRLERIERKSE
jgi:hypothetical protein